MHIIRELRQLGWQVDVVDVGDGFPFPSAAQRATALAVLSAVPTGRPTTCMVLAFEQCRRPAPSDPADR